MTGLAWLVRGLIHTWSSPLQPALAGAVRILLQQDSKQLDKDGEVVSHTDRAGHREDI